MLKLNSPIHDTTTTIYHSLVPLSGKNNIQLGREGLSRNLLHTVNISNFSMSPLVTMGQFGRFVADIRKQRMAVPASCRLAYHEGTDQYVLVNHDKNGPVTLFSEFVNGTVRPDEVEMVDGDITPIPSKIDFALLKQGYPIFKNPNTPVALVNIPDCLLFLDWLNRGLFMERQCGNLPQGAWFMLPSGDEMEYAARGVDGNHQYGTDDGHAPDFSKRLFRAPHILMSLDRPVVWNGKQLPQMSGVFWSRCRDRADDKNGVIHGGSWMNLELPLLEASSRSPLSPFVRDANFSFRVMMPD